jgi:hypothetical protein
MSTTRALRLLEQQYFDFNSVRNGRSITEFVMTDVACLRSGVHGSTCYTGAGLI